MEFVSMSARQYREMISKGKKSFSSGNKYGAKKTAVDGITFDSKHESQDYLRYKSMEKAGIIQNLQLQKKFILQEGFTNNQGQKIREIAYFADFYFLRDGKQYVVDSKSVITKKDKTYRLKKKLFEFRYKDIIFLES